MKIINSKIADQQLRRVIDLEVEEFWILGLKPDKTILNSKCLFRGTVDACLVHPRDVFRFACLTNSSSLIVSHSHPSGDHQPSKHDIHITRQLVKAAKLMQIPITDHLIITEKEYWSFADEGFI